MRQTTQPTTVDVPAEPTTRRDIPECVCPDESGQQRNIGIFAWGAYCTTCGGRV